MSMVIYGFIGQAESGKTTACKILSKLFYEAGLHPKMISFAGPLKRAVAQSNGYDDWEKFKNEHPDLYRSECQRIGTECREKDKDHWVNLWLADVEAAKVKAAESDFPYVVLTDDIRYPNELELLRKIGGQVVYIDRQSKMTNRDAPFRSHISETEANSIALFWESRRHTGIGDTWPAHKVNIGVDNNDDIVRLTNRLRDMVEIWTAPVDVCLSHHNPFLYAVARDYKIAYGELKTEHLIELSETRLSDELIYRYAQKSAKSRRPRR